MSNSFNTQQLAGHRVLVTGVDNKGENRHAILDSSEWDSLRHDKTEAQAKAEFDRATKAFYAPLTAAADALEKAQLPKLDPAYTYVVTEGEAGTDGVEESIIELDDDSVVLRLLEQGDTTRLIWVGDTIEILAAPATPVVEVPVVEDVTGDSTGDVTTPGVETTQA